MSQAKRRHYKHLPAPPQPGDDHQTLSRKPTGLTGRNLEKIMSNFNTHQNSEQREGMKYVNDNRYIRQVSLGRGGEGGQTGRK